MTEFEIIREALTNAHVHLAGLDQADSAREGLDRPQYSALRARVEQALEALDRIQSPNHIEPCVPPLGPERG